MNKLAITALAAVAAASAWAIQGTIITDKDQKTGDIKWQPRSKSYSVTFKKGNTNVAAEYPIADVKSLDIEKPQSFDKLVGLVKTGQGASAIAGLSAIVQSHKMLVWDRPAGRYLVEAYLAAGQAQKAYDTAAGIIAEDRSAAYMGELAPAYWQALLKLGKIQQLENCLRKASSEGDRVASAEALMMRGDMILATDGDSVAAHRKAPADAYPRVVFMYNDPVCKDARRDANQIYGRGYGLRIDRCI